MQLKEAISMRHSSRSFKNLKVKKDDILDIIDCARLAPSAGNRQNWYFVVLEEKKKNNISLLLNNYVKENKTWNVNCSSYNPIQSVLESAKAIKEASVLILIFRYDNVNWLKADYLSIGGAIENMILRATDLGINSLELRDIIYIKDKITNLFDFNIDMELVAGLALGYEYDTKYRAKKKEIEKVMRFEK